MRRETRTAHRRKVRASNGYIYNLRIPKDVVSGELFTIRVSLFGDAETGPDTSMYVALRIK